jgi:pyruvate-formate lyase-activating enzyme
MPANEVLEEAKKLHRVGDSLEVLADQNPPVEEALTVISGNVHDTANLLKVVVAMKMGLPAELDTVIH